MKKTGDDSNTGERSSLNRLCEKVDATPRVFIPTGFQYSSRRQKSQSTSGNDDTLDVFLSISRNESAQNACSKFRASEDTNGILANSEANILWHNDHQSALNFWEQTAHSDYIPRSKIKQQRVEPKHG